MMLSVHPASHFHVALGLKLANQAKPSSQGLLVCASQAKLVKTGHAASFHTHLVYIGATTAGASNKDVYTMSIKLQALVASEQRSTSVTPPIEKLWSASTPAPHWHLNT